MPTVLALIVMTARAALAALLIAAGAAKLATVREFAGTLVGLGLPARRQWLVAGTAYGIPVVEVAVGLLTAIRVWPVATGVAVLVLWSIFTAVTGWALVKRLRVACRCFGALTNSQFSRRALARNAGLSAVAALVLWYEATRAPGFDRPPDATLLLLGGYGLLALAAAQAAATLGMLREAAEASRG